MSDVPDQIAQLQSELASLRRECARRRRDPWVVLGVLAIMFACNDRTVERAPEQPKRIVFGGVVLDETGLQISGGDGDGVSLRKSGLSMTAKRGYTSISANHLVMTEGDDKPNPATATMVSGMVAVTSSRSRDDVRGATLTADSLRIADGPYSVTANVGDAHAVIEVNAKASVSTVTAALEAKLVTARVEATVKRGDKADTKGLYAVEK